jgi:Leucine-rich repeat (LRR) protein
MQESPSKTNFPQFHNFTVVEREYSILDNLEKQYGSLSNRVEINRKRVIGLNLSGLNLNKFPNYIYRLSRLISLDLSDSQITRIPKAIQFFRRLRYLYLNQNAIRTLPDWIGCLKYLEKVALNNNPLNQLPLSFAKLRYLQKLELENTRLENLPESIYDLSLLEILKLKGTSIKKFEKKIGTLKHLHQLNNVILPVSIGNLSIKERWAIWELALFGTPEIQISNDVVISIQFHRQRLKQIPATIGNFSSLRILNLAENQLSTLPSTIGNLKELRKLDLSFNSISSLPNTLANLIHLEDLDLTWNPLYILPKWFGQLKLIKRLYLTGTMIHDFSEILSCFNLSVLYLDSNELTEFETELSKLSQLEYLVLSYNHLGTIPDSIKNIPNLKYLRINLNHIARLPDWISSLDKLELLDISDNHLSCIPASLGDHSSLIELYLDGNPWSPFFRKHILGYENPMSETELAREFSLDLDENLDYSPFFQNEIEMNPLEDVSNILEDIDEWQDYDPEENEFNLLIEDSANFIERSEFSTPPQPPFQYQTKRILENLKRLKNHIPTLQNKIIENQPLDEFDLEFPDYAKFTGSLLEICKKHSNDTSRAVYELLKASGLVGSGDFRIWL